MDFRLFWDAITEALAGREKIIIDADRVPGRRHLFLADPGRIGVPVLPATPAPRERPRGRADGDGPFGDGR